MNRRIRKKKGLLRDPWYSQVKREIVEAIEEKGNALEQEAVKGGK